MTEGLGNSALIPLVGALVQAIVASFRASGRLSSKKTLMCVYGFAFFLTGLAFVGQWDGEVGRGLAVFAANAILTAFGAAVWAIGQRELTTKDRKLPGNDPRRDDPPGRPAPPEGGRVPFDDPPGRG